MSDTGNTSAIPTISLSDTTSVKPARESAWTSRLPLEIMTQILEVLAAETKLGTLARCQETSSAMYTLVTPILYRNIAMNEEGALKLLCLFQDIPQSDKQLFLHPVPQIDHPVHMPLPTRLRYSLRHTRSLTLEVDFCNTEYLPVLDYVELAHALKYSRTMDLWPSLERITIDLTRIAIIGHLHKSRFDVIKAVLAGLDIKHLTIRLPGPAVVGSRQHQGWDDLMDMTKAEHIDITNYGIDQYCSGPSASTSLTLRFSESLAINPWEKFKRATIRLRATVKTIKIFGIHENAPQHRLTHEAVLYKRIMRLRLAAGHEEDLKIGYVSKGEDEKDIVWRVLKAKDYKDE